jgi:hypothetical protein
MIDIKEMDDYIVMVTYDKAEAELLMKICTINNVTEYDGEYHYAGIFNKLNKGV